MKKFDSKQLSIRKYKPEDNRKLTNLLKTHSSDFHLTSIDDIKQLHLMNKIVLVAIYKNKIIGSVSADIKHNYKRIIIGYFLVSEKYKISGVLNLLIKRIEKIAKRKYSLATSFCSFIVNNNMLNLILQDCGYQHCGTYKNFILSEGVLLNQTFFLKLIK